MFCAPGKCKMSKRACECNQRVALTAISKLLNFRTVTELELNRVMAFGNCSKGDRELSRQAIHGYFRNLFDTEIVPEDNFSLTDTSKNVLVDNYGGNDTNAK